MARPHDHTSMGGADREFPATQWTRILSGERREALLAELYQAYWKPIYCYLRAMGFANEHAKDLVQGFFSEKVLSEGILEKADPKRGRFRSLLLRAVHNFAISARRVERSHQTLGEGQESASPDRDAEAAFDRAWADGLLQEVLGELELECTTRRKLTHWHLFRDWLLEPGPGDQGGRQMTEICLKYGVADPSAAYHMVENLKRRFRAILRDRLAQQTGTEEGTEEELHRFIEVFSRPSAR
jgi:DNA-directed RNA polymerase specialized sigma24 family protein